MIFSQPLSSDLYCFCFRPSHDVSVEGALTECSNDHLALVLVLVMDKAKESDSRFL